VSYTLRTSLPVGHRCETSTGIDAPRMRHARAAMMTSLVMIGIQVVVETRKGSPT